MFPWRTTKTGRKTSSMFFHHWAHKSSSEILLVKQRDTERWRKMLLRSSLSIVHAPVRSIGLCNYPRAFSTVQRGLLQQTTKTSESKDSKSDKIPLWARIKTASTFAFASTVVVGAAGLAGLVIYLVVAEIVLPSGDTQVFNKAVSMVETDPKAQELLLLEPGKRLKAYGETTDNKWTRNRPISSTRRMDKSGKEHLFMRFHVESKQRHGSVQLESIHDDVLHPEYSYIYLDVPGEKRHYIIAPPQPKLLGSRDPNAGFLGVRWGPKTE